MNPSKHPLVGVWAKIETWLESNVSALYQSLQPPADEEELRRVESILGVQLPEDIAISYLIHNGQTENLVEGTYGLVGTYELLSLERIVMVWRQWAEAAQRGDFSGAVAEGSGPVRPVWWNISWIPFSTNDNSDCYCADLSPGSGGRQGQVIQVWHDDPLRVVKAASFTAWLTEFADELVAGQYVFSEDLGGLVHIDEL